jgi:hypothetical protein
MPPDNLLFSYLKRKNLQPSYDYPPPSAFIETQRTRSPSPSRSLEANLSAICDRLLANPGQVASMVAVFPGSSPISSTEEFIASSPPRDFDADSEAGAQAAIELLNELEGLEERDDFANDNSATIRDVVKEKQRDITPELLESFRNQIQYENKCWSDAKREEEKKTKSHKKYIDTRTDVQKLWDIERHHRGCARGACCVYSVWYDPEFGGHGNCHHKCAVSHGSDKRCGPSLLALDLPTLYYPSDTRGDNSRVVFVPPPSNPRLWKQKHRVLSRDSKKSNKKTQIALSFNETRHNDILVAVAPKEHEPSLKKCRKQRVRKIVPTIQRVRTCMGKRAFGKVSRRPQVFHELPKTVDTTDDRFRDVSPRWDVLEDEEFSA